MLPHFNCGKKNNSWYLHADQLLHSCHAHMAPAITVTHIPTNAGLGLLCSTVYNMFCHLKAFDLFPQPNTYIFFSY